MPKRKRDSIDVVNILCRLVPVFATLLEDFDFLTLGETCVSLRKYYEIKKPLSIQFCQSTRTRFLQLEIANWSHWGKCGLVHAHGHVVQVTYIRRGIYLHADCFCGQSGSLAKILVADKLCGRNALERLLQNISRLLVDWDSFLPCYCERTPEECDEPERVYTCQCIQEDMHCECNDNGTCRCINSASQPTCTCVIPCVIEDSECGCDDNYDNYDTCYCKKASEDDIEEYDCHCPCGCRNCRSKIRGYCRCARVWKQLDPNWFKLNF